MSFVTTACPAHFRRDARLNRGLAVGLDWVREDLDGRVLAIQVALKPSDPWLASQDGALADSAAAGRGSAGAAESA